jgi:hypothetical protein
MLAVTFKNLVVGRIYRIRYNGEIRLVTVESHGKSHKSGKEYVTVTKQDDAGKTVYRNYFLENIEIL